MDNKKHIIITMSLSAVIVVGLGFYAEKRNNSSPSLLVDDPEMQDQLFTDELPTHDEQIAIDGPLTPEEQLVSNPDVSNNMNPTAVISTNRGVVELELFADQMPITVGNFVALSNSDFYNGIKFHRVIDGFMIQGGDPNSRGENEASWGTGGADNIQDEFVEGELLTNVRGTIAMANTGQPNSGGSQWFINLVDNTNLDFNKQPLSSKHPVFGRVTSGLDIVDAIGSTPTKQGNIPVDPVIIESITIVQN